MKRRKSKIIFFLKRLIFLFISFWFWIISYLWYKVLGFFRISRKGTCIVLMYHYVKPKHIKQFSKQINDLVKLCKLIAIDYEGPLEKGKRYVAVTFDDGYVSFFENALPELEKRNIPCTVFVPTGYIGLSPDWLGNRLFDIHDEVIMNSSQLKTISENSVIIGSHGVSHQDLLSLKPEDVLKELKKSKSILESIIGKDIVFLSIPFGNYNQQIVKFAKETGYKRLFSNCPKPAFSNESEYITGRITVSPDDWRLEFILKLHGAYCWLSYAFALKQIIITPFKILIKK